MLAKILSSALIGIDAYVVEVEVDTATGMINLLKVTGATGLISVSGAVIVILSRDKLRTSPTILRRLLLCPLVHGLRPCVYLRGKSIPHFGAADVRARA